MMIARIFWKQRLRIATLVISVPRPTRGCADGAAPPAWVFDDGQTKKLFALFVWTKMRAEGGSVKRVHSHLNSLIVSLMFRFHVWKIPWNTVAIRHPCVSGSTLVWINQTGQSLAASSSPYPPAGLSELSPIMFFRRQGQAAAQNANVEIFNETT